MLVFRQSCFQRGASVPSLLFPGIPDIGPRITDIHFHFSHKVVLLIEPGVEENSTEKPQRMSETFFRGSFIYSNLMIFFGKKRSPMKRREDGQVNLNRCPCCLRVFLSVRALLRTSRGRKSSMAGFRIF